jgi:6,7-dimethyl-8-ribityllumazine synthase
MARRIEPTLAGAGRRVGIVLSRFNPEVGDRLLDGALRALKESGVADDGVVVATVPGALETPLALQAMARTGRYAALVALGAVIRGETYHFEIVSNESAAGVTRVGLDFDIPIGNGILTTEDDVQALVRAEQKGYEAAQAALELANLRVSIDEDQAR